jgi:gliding motility-associated-like protein
MKSPRNRMRYFYLILAFCSLFSEIAFAQPSNDICSTAIDLGTAPYCKPTVVFSNIGANQETTFPVPTCFEQGIAPRDVWFSFIASDTILDYTITVEGKSSGLLPALKNPQLAIYRGECLPGELFQISCNKPNGDINVLEINGLTPGALYFLRITDFSGFASGAGAFSLCIEKQNTTKTIDQGSSTACFGKLYDSGGPNGDYKNNENYVFTICPNNAPSCIEMNLTYFNIEQVGFFSNTNYDLLTFYDGPKVDPLKIIKSLPETLTDDGGGGVQYNVKATSGCMTVRWRSDTSTVFEGWEGIWNCSGQPCPQIDTLAIRSNIQDQDIINSIASSNVKVSNLTINCNSATSVPFGIFDKGNQAKLGINKGLLLTTGSSSLVNGPNNRNNAGRRDDRPGDFDLDTLSKYQNQFIIDWPRSQDACVVELDVFSPGDQLSFEYIFGSEEYPEFVGSDFNDIFAFLVSGPGIVGDPNLKNKKNIALVPGKNQPVQINSVNNLNNYLFYRNNIGKFTSTFGDSTFFNPINGQSIQYDGLTSDSLGRKLSLTAQTKVIPCNTYRLKLAIADRGDDDYDSGVFISDLNVGGPKISLNFLTGVDYLAEKCNGGFDKIEFRLDAVATDTLTYNLAISGSAILGVDYTFGAPSIIRFLPGEQVKSFSIIPLNDNVVEPTENIVLETSRDFGCGKITFSKITIPLRDELKLDILNGLDTAYYCSGNTVKLNVTGANTYFWTPVSIMDNPLSSTPTAKPTMDTWVFVEGQVGTCVGKDSIFLRGITPTINIQTSSDKICEGESINLLANTNTSGQGLMWSPSIFFTDPNAVITNFKPIDTVMVYGRVTLGTCSVVDSVLIFVDEFRVPRLFPDLVICEGDRVDIANPLPYFGTKYNWSPAIGLDTIGIPNPKASPVTKTTYILTTTSASDRCVSLDTIVVDVKKSKVEILEKDTVFICLGQELNICARTTNDDTTTLRWNFPNGNFVDSLGKCSKFTPEESGILNAKFSINGCNVEDKIFIRVDSLPDLSYARDPNKGVYCPGEKVILRLKNFYEEAFFPNIEFKWLNPLGAITQDFFPNLVVNAPDTTVIYNIRVFNNECKDTVQVTLPVGTVGSVTPAFTDSLVCPGTRIQLRVSLTGTNKLKWEPATGLSCADCLDPFVTVNSAVSYTVMADGVDCPGSATINLGVINVQDNIPTPRTICPGQTVDLNPNSVPNQTYSWTSTNDPSFSPTNNPNPQVQPVNSASYNVVIQNGKCSVTRGVDVIVERPTISFSGDTTVCLGTSTVLTANVQGTTNPVFIWNGVTSGPTFSFSPTQAGNTPVDFQLIYGNNCRLTRRVNITTLPPQQVSLSFVPNIDSVDAGTVINFTALPIPDVAGNKYEWSQNGIVSSRSGKTASFTINTIADGRITLSVTSPEGCTAQAQKNFGVREANFGIPNNFTPDGDGINDVFQPVVKGPIRLSAFTVTNRWGDQLHNKPEPWDGTMNGTPAPVEVYFYMMEFTLSNGTKRIQKGNVTLLR